MEEKFFNYNFNSMDNETLKIKKLKGYRNAFLAFLILTYVIGRAGGMIKQSGGTSEGIAIFIVAVQAISPLVMIFCGVMWIKIKREASKEKSR